MMDRKFLEEHLSAFLDGELSAKEMHDFEQALKEHPDLLAEVAEFRRLDSFGRRSQLDLPPEVYFDNLAERIDARLNREVAPQKKSLLRRFFSAELKYAGQIATVAALLLVVFVVNQIYKGAREEFFHPERGMRKPTERMTDTTGQAAVVDAAEVHDKLGGTGVPGTALPLATEPTAESPKKVEKAAIEQNLGETKFEIPAPTEGSRVRGGRSGVLIDRPQTSGAQESAIVLRRELIAPKATANAPAQFSDQIAADAEREPADGGAAFSEERRHQLETAFGPGYTTRLEPAKLENDLRNLLDSGRYLIDVPVTDAIRSKESSLRSGRGVELPPLKTSKQLSLAESKPTPPDSVTMARNHAEVEYQTARSSKTAVDVLIARLYIEHYLTLLDAADQPLWLSRLDTLKQLERQGKTDTPRK